MEDNNVKTFNKNVRAAIDIVALISKTIPLTHETGEWYAGATSANSKSGKSLKVNCREQYYKNFATGDKGDVFNWIAYTESLDIVNDFPKILKIACDEAGIPFESFSKEDKDNAAEVQIVQDALTQAAEVYHGNLTPEIRAYIRSKWGISDDTIDSLKIGYAKPGNGANLYSIIPDEILAKTGLINVVIDNGQDQMIVEHFQGRVIFPYWNAGKVVNFAARGAERDKEGQIKYSDEYALLQTPDSKYEAAKYKKLLVHSEKRPYINKSVNNRYLFGEDSIRKQNFCVITEGIADAIILMQNGIPVLSPVTVQFASKDYDKLVNAAKNLKTVYICNDNELSEAGENGAIKTALLLKNEGVDAKIILLPKENLDKMDVAEYFLRHTKAEFDAVKEHSKDILVHLLNKVQPSKCPDATIAKTENVKKALEFARTVLKNILNEDEVLMFIRNNIKNYFPKFTMDDIKIIIKTYKTAIAEDTSRNEEQERKMTFDLDSESGRSTMVQVLSKEVMQQKDIKFIAGSLRIYENGIYPANPESLKKLQKDIMSIAINDHKTPIIEKHVNNVIKVVEIMTSTSQQECNTTENEIAVGNGILDLKTFELSEFTPDKVFFNKLPVDYIPNAPEPTKFIHLMKSVFKGNEEQYNLMQEVFGYCLLNNYKYQVIIYLLGDGGNGKGTVLKVLSYLLGTENTSSATLFQLTDHHNVDYYLARLHGKRANICGDVGSTKIENTENIKKLSSNTDLISARLPYGLPFEFINAAKIIFAMNKLPKKDAFTTGDKRRDVIISFNNRMSDTDNEIKGLSEIIRDSGELPGVLNWAIEGLKRLERNQKFSDKRTIAQRGLEYDMKSNPVKHFVDECIESDPKGGSLPNVLIYDAYTTYRLKHGLPELSDTELKNGLKYWCSQIGIQTSEKREYAEKILGFDLNDSLKEKLGKRPHVFTGIKLIKDTDEPQQKVTPEPVKPEVNEQISNEEAFNSAFCD